jgi:hypothetical protein
VRHVGAAVRRGRFFANVGLAAQSGSPQVDSGLDFTTTYLRSAMGAGLKL